VLSARFVQSNYVAAEGETRRNEKRRCCGNGQRKGESDWGRSGDPEAIGARVQGEEKGAGEARRSEGPSGTRSTVVLRCCKLRSQLSSANIVLLYRLQLAADSVMIEDIYAGVDGEHTHREFTWLLKDPKFKDDATRWAAWYVNHVTGWTNFNFKKIVVSPIEFKMAKLEEERYVIVPNPEEFASLPLPVPERPMVWVRKGVSECIAVVL
jgi:hypothetical protein